jgi:hypothetical protein
MVATGARGEVRGSRSKSGAYLASVITGSSDSNRLPWMTAWGGPLNHGYLRIVALQ